MPGYSEDMTASISMTGLTILKDGKYNNRIGESAEYINHLPFGIVRKKSIPLTPGEIAKLENKRPVKKLLQDPTPPKPRKQRSFTINKKQITHRIKNFTHQMPGEKKLYFWTVTFPEGTTDDTGFLLLNRWLTRLRKEKMLRSYLWISERQDGKRLQDSNKPATNTIHFHLAFHQRICVKKANRFMRAAIFTSIKDGTIKFSRKAAKNYNGVDISKDRKTKRVINFAKGNKQKSLANYLTKYVTKNSSEFTHLAWHCSRDYSNLIINIRVTKSELVKFNLLQCFSEGCLFEDQFFQFFPWLNLPDKSFLDHIGQINRHIVNEVNSFSNN